jgi:hypothetical protein
MLPSSKRPPRAQDPSEIIRTGDYEVVHSSSSRRGDPRAQGARGSDRPRVFQPSVDDEDKTTLFAGSIRTMLPPKPMAGQLQVPSARPGKQPNANLRGLVRESAREKPPSPESLRNESPRGAARPRADTEDRTILRPTSTLPPALQRAVAQGPQAAQAAPASPPSPPSPRPSSARPPAMMPTPYVPMRPLGAAGHSAPPVSFNAPGGSDRKTDPPGDPPSSVITAKTRIIRAKSSLTWAAGLMALGAVVGLVTAVVARGDADAVLDATATLVDPSHTTAAAHANAAVAQAAVLPSFVETGKHVAPLGTDQNPAPGACTDTPAAASAPLLTVSTPVVVNAPPPPAKGAPDVKTTSIAGAEPQAASHPAPPKPAPVAWAAPARVAPKAAAAQAPQQASATGNWLANVTPANAGAPITRPSSAKAAAKGANPGSGGEFESAAAADALAKAQLEASLR